MTWQTPFAPVSDQIHWPVIVIGGGQAGLSASYWLQQHSIRHLVLEKHSVGHAWRNNRWDSFCLVTPNWQCRLPGFPYDGNDPNGFMPRDAIVDYIERYAAFVKPPLLQGVTVETLQRYDSGGYELVTTEGRFTADQVVMAVNGYHVPNWPRLSERLPTSLEQLHSSDYKSPETLPAGEILVIGTGQSGCQIAEDLHLAGRRVHLCVGRAPRAPRWYRGRDSVDWLEEMGTYEVTVDEHPEPAWDLRHKANHYMTGRDGGREIDLRRFAQEGMQLYGRVADIRNGTHLIFGQDLKQNLDGADDTYCRIRESIDRYIEKNNIQAPSEPEYRPIWEPEREPRELDLEATSITTVIWATGFHSDFSWVHLPVFDGAGEPVHQRGITPTPGAYFLGLPWLHTWGSGRFASVGDDARHVVEFIANRTEATTEVSASEQEAMRA